MTTTMSISKVNKYLIPIIFLIVQFKGDAVAKNSVLDISDIKVSSDIVNAVAEKNIYFGHQSVGFNMLDGIKDILSNRQDSRLKIIKSKNESVFQGSVFAHYPIGENSDPESKIDDFKKTMSKIGSKVDIAFFKFCFLDINKTTDVDKVFETYKHTMTELKKEFPRVKFIHVTVPLTVTKFSLRNTINKIIGRKDNNVIRGQYNKKLIVEYAGKEPIFDLAAIESTYSDGSRSEFTENSKLYYSLAPEYAADNGHLNELGRKLAASELLKLLSIK